MINKEEKHDLDHTYYPSYKEQNKQYSYSRSETLGDMLRRRNRLIIEVFKSSHKIELYGKADAPMIVLERDIKISAYVKNFNLHFKTTPSGDEKYMSIKLSPTTSLSSSFISDLIMNCQHEDWAEVVKRQLIKKYTIEENYNE